jgi:hypothetical protein
VCSRACTLSQYRTKLLLLSHNFSNVMIDNTSSNEAHYTHGLWTHDTHPISFSLVVDDFGVKYVGQEHAEHLMSCIKKNYNISSDWNGMAYCGLTLDWDYNDRTVDLSMPGYIKAALHKYQHPAPARPEHSPHTWNPPIYGANTQFMSDTKPSPAL